MGDDQKAPSQQDIDAQVTADFRAQGGTGELMGGRMHADRLVLLTTTGRRSGERRTRPMMVLDLSVDGTDRTVVVGGNAGAPTDPGWVHNLRADPFVTVERGDRTYEARAVELAGQDREQAWPRVLEIAPFFGKYAEQSGREIPVVELRET